MKNIVRILLIIAVFLLIFFLVYFIYRIIKKESVVSDDSTSEVQEKDKTPPVSNDNLTKQSEMIPFEIILTCSDDMSGCDKTFYTLDDSEPTINSNVGNRILLNTIGKYTLKYFSIDKSGNIEKINTKIFTLYVQEAENNVDNKVSNQPPFVSIKKVVQKPVVPVVTGVSIGEDGDDMVILNFSTQISASGEDLHLGFSIRMDSANITISDVQLQNDLKSLRIDLAAPMVFGDQLFISYNADVGTIKNLADSTELNSFVDKIIVNNITTPWYLAGGVPEPLAAYQADGSASIEDSKINLVNPGVNDLTPVLINGWTSPGWSSENGWIMPGSTAWNTGIIPGRTYSALIRYSNQSNISYALFGSDGRNGMPSVDFAIDMFNAPGVFEATMFLYGNINTGPMVVYESSTEGVLGLTPYTSWTNGNLTLTKTDDWAGESIYPIFIGARNHHGSPTFPSIGNIQRFVVWNTDISEYMPYVSRSILR